MEGELKQAAARKPGDYMRAGAGTLRQLVWQLRIAHGKYHIIDGQIDPLVCCWRDHETAGERAKRGQYEARSLLPEHRNAQGPEPHHGMDVAAQGKGWFQDFRGRRLVDKAKRRLKQFAFSPSD